MLKRALTTGVAAFVAAACADTTTDPIGPIQTAVTKTALCHWDATTGQFTLISVPVGGKPYQKHLAHGDGEPGGAVPGTPGYVFDDNCLQVASERVFAIAYTDVDPNDGPGFKDGTDVLIAKLVDTNNDGVVSAGDQVIMGNYPKDFDATQFGDFGIKAHTVTEVWSATANSAVTVVVTTGIIGFGTSPLYNGVPEPFEIYGELSPSAANALALMDWNRDYMVDRIETITGRDPSQPDADVNLAQGLPSNPDQAFLDVEINLAGL